MFTIFWILYLGLHMKKWKLYWHVLTESSYLRTEKSFFFWTMLRVIQNLWLISLPRSKSFCYRRIQLRGYNHWMLVSSKISKSSTKRSWLRYPGGCICKTNCQGCGCTCGYLMTTRSIRRSNRLNYLKSFQETQH